VIINHKPAQSHPGVLKEQWVSFEDHSCPGDMCDHPDFQCGAILPTLIYQFGLAAADGELAKTSDIKML